MNIIEAMFKWVEEQARYQKSIEYCDKMIVDYQYQKDKLLNEIKNCDIMIQHYKQRRYYLKRKENQKHGKEKNND